MRLNLARLNRTGLAWPKFGLVALAILATAAVVLKAGQDDHPERSRSLLGILAKWKYPDSTMQGGASMSDGGNRQLQSVKCKAILTTPDPIEKVIAYYTKELETHSQQEGGADVVVADAKSVAIHNDSKDRPVTIRVIAVNKAESSTTLVISRARGEAETHIAWLHYSRLDGK